MSAEAQQTAIRAAMVVMFLAVGFFIGRPLYSEAESRFQDFVAQRKAVGQSSLLAQPGEAGLSGDEAISFAGIPDPDADVDTVPLDKAALAQIKQRREERDKLVAATGGPATAEGGGVPALGDLNQGKGPSEQAAGQDEGLEGEEALARGVRPILHQDRPLADALKRDIWDAPPATDPMPPKEEFALRKSLVGFRARYGVIVITFANFAFMDFATNWVRHLTDNGVYNVLVGAMDQKLLEALFRLGVPTFDVESGMPTQDAGWGSKVFHQMGREKVTLINVFLAMGFELLICDTDTVFLKNPLPYMSRFREADVLTSSDHVVRTVDDDGLEDYRRAATPYNIGALYFRVTDSSKKFARAWAELLASDDKIWDQNGFNDLMRKQWGPQYALGKNLFHAFDGVLKLGILPVSIFCSGHTYFLQHLYERVGLQPYMIHTTFQYGGTPGKRHRLREAMQFYDPPEYYADPPGGILSFVNVIPEELLSGGPHTLQSHFALANYELRNLRTALALALMLKRTLVVPELWCRFDRLWYPHTGMLDGVDMAQPFLCPLDHLVEVDKLIPGGLPDADFGPSISFREYSFLQNPRTPQELLKSKMTVQLCDKGSPGCEPPPQPPSSSPPPASLSLPKNSSQNQILSSLEAYADVKWIEFSALEGALGSWDDEGQEKLFRRRLQHTGGLWCCVNAHPGHIWYDFYTDEKPGWTPKPPTRPQDDHPPIDNL